jgi:hypothetical protein
VRPQGKVNTAQRHVLPDWERVHAGGAAAVQA